MLKLEQAIIVEGKYDKLHLSNMVDGLVVSVGGFHIYKDREMQNFIRSLAQTRGIVILTDSDAAGFRIRNFLKNIAAKGRVYHAYIPDIYGKERRKDHASAEGKLGVEGIPRSVLMESLAACGITPTEGKEKKDPISRIDLYEAGITGGTDSRRKRKELLQHLGLPEHLSGNMLLQCIDSYMTRTQLLEFVNREKGANGEENHNQCHLPCAPCSDGMGSTGNNN